MNNINLEQNTEVEYNLAKQGGGILTFYVEDQVYGIEILYVTDIIEIQPITFVPRIPSYIEGVINLRGKVIPVMNVRLRFGKEKIPYDERTCIIVIEHEDTSVGVIVDRVCEVMDVMPDQVTPPPDYKSVNSNRFIKNIIKAGEDVKLLLDCQKLIFE